MDAIYARVCVCALAFVCNYRFVIEYVASHVSAKVECRAVCFDMIKLICEYSYRVMTAKII